MENIKDIIENHLSNGVVLMDFVHDKNSDFVKITIDSPSNISIGETSKIAHRIKNDVSILSLFPKGCSIEVGTPGVGARLTKKFQYKKNIGRKIFLEYHENNSEVKSDVFRLISVQKKGIKVSKNKNDLFILFENIFLAKIKVSFD